MGTRTIEALHLANAVKHMTAAKRLWGTETLQLDLGGGGSVVSEGVDHRVTAYLWGPTAKGEDMCRSVELADLAKVSRVVGRKGLVTLGAEVDGVDVALTVEQAATNTDLLEALRRAMAALAAKATLHRPTSVLRYQVTILNSYSVRFHVEIFLDQSTPGVVQCGQSPSQEGAFKCR